jgi:multidrug efflux pump subunit AcrB
MISILTGGAYGALTLVREMFPESRPNRVLVTTEYPGASPSEVEKGIILKIEEQIKDVDGVEKIESTANEGRGTIFVEMESGLEDIDQAVNDIKAAVDSIDAADFPEEALETRVRKFEPKWPVISVALHGDLDDRTLKTLGEQLRNDVLALPGISDVALSGTRKDEISVEVSPQKLVEFGLSFMEVAEAIATSNLDLPGGQVRTPGSNVAVRTLGEKDRGDQLYDIVIRSDPSGRVIGLRDVATIVDGFEDVDVMGRFGAMPAVDVTVYKTADEDAVAIAGRVRALVAGKMGNPLNLPWDEKLRDFFSDRGSIRAIYDNARSDAFSREVRLALHTDLSRYVEGRLDLLKRNGFWGLILVVISLLTFLHWRVALWVMMGLLLAITGSLICMKLMGLTLNLITMLGLIIVLGLLVDDAIIVGEHVYSKVEEGVEPKLAAITGTEEVTWPVVCAILTTIVAFVPLMYIEGQMGDWMGVLPMIVCVALSVSLIEALTILPSHLAHGLCPLASGDASRSHLRPRWLAEFAARVRHTQHEYVQQKLRTLYERLLRLAIANRYVTIAALTGLLIIASGAVAGRHVPFVFLPKMDSETLVVNLKMGVGTPVEATRRAVGMVEEATLDLAELKTVYTLIGLQMSDDGVISAPQSHLSQMFIELVPSEERDRSSMEILQELRGRTGDIPGVEKLKYSSLQGGPGGAPIHIEISGPTTDDLVKVAASIKERLSRFDGVFDIVDDSDAGQREVKIELFDSGRALDLSTQSLATQVRSAFYGFEARKVQRGREDVKIMVRYPQEYRRRIYDIESMRLATPAGGMVPFTEVARLTEGTGYASINRKNQKRAVTITADVDPAATNADQVMAELSRGFPAMIREYPGVALEFGGQKLETRKSFGSLKQNFLTALLLIYVILAALFRSYVQPLIVMAVIPFGMIGAVAGHYVMGYPLTILSLIGIVALSGIVVNDSMILVTFINRHVAKGMPRVEAVVAAGKSRLRPILLTSATTVLGVAPLLAEESFQARFLIPMGISIAAGLLFATVLTLVAIPSLYLIMFDFKAIFRRTGSWLLGQPAFLAETRS